MNETTNVIEMEAVKPYKFRRLEAVDMFVMCKIISAIGVNEFKMIFESKGITDLIQKMSAEKGEKVTKEEDFLAVGASVFLDLAQVIITNIPKCEKEIYQLLAQVADMKVEHIRKLDAITFTEMVIDFVKKEEFGDFIKVVSRLFK